MPRRISSTEASAKLASLVRWTHESDDEVIIESHGVPRAVLLSYQAYDDLLRWRENARRETALAELRALRRRVRERNADLDTTQAAELADRAARDTVEEMIADGSITRQED